MDFMGNFGKKLLELRKHVSLSQEQLALDLNISQSSISNYESGATKPDVDILQKIAEYFKIPFADFFSDEKKRFNANENISDNIINSTFDIMMKKLIGIYESKIKELEDELRLLKDKKSGGA